MNALTLLLLRRVKALARVDLLQQNDNDSRAHGDECLDIITAAKSGNTCESGLASTK